MDGQRKTLRTWLQRAGFKNLGEAVQWCDKIRDAENQQAANVVIRRKVGKNPETGEDYPFFRGLPVSYRGVDPITGKKECSCEANNGIPTLKGTSLQWIGRLLKQR